MPKDRCSCGTNAYCWKHRTPGTVKAKKPRRVVLGEGYFLASNGGFGMRAFEIYLMTRPRDGEAKTLKGYPPIQNKRVRLIAEVLETVGGKTNG